MQCTNDFSFSGVKIYQDDPFNQGETLGNFGYQKAMKWFLLKEQIFHIDLYIKPQYNCIDLNKIRLLTGDWTQM